MSHAHSLGNALTSAEMRRIVPAPRAAPRGREDRAGRVQRRETHTRHLVHGPVRAVWLGACARNAAAPLTAVAAAFPSYDDPNSATSSFSILLGDAPHLDKVVRAGRSPALFCLAVPDRLPLPLCLRSTACSGRWCRGKACCARWSRRAIAALARFQHLRAHRLPGACTGGDSA